MAFDKRFASLGKKFAFDKRFAGLGKKFALGQKFIECSQKKIALADGTGITGTFLALQIKAFGPKKICNLSEWAGMAVPC